MNSNSKTVILSSFKLNTTFGKSKVSIYIVKLISMNQIILLETNINKPLDSKKKKIRFLTFYQQLKINKRCFYLSYCKYETTIFFHFSKTKS